MDSNSDVSEVYLDESCMPDSESSESSISFSEQSFIFNERDVHASTKTLNGPDLSDSSNLSSIEIDIKKKVSGNNCLASYSFSLPNYQKPTKNNIWPSFSNTDDNTVENEINENFKNIIMDNNKIPQGNMFNLIDDAVISALNCPEINSDEEDDDKESDISDFTYNSVDDLNSIFKTNNKTKSTRKNSSDDKKENHSPINSKTNNFEKMNVITRDLDDIGIYFRSNIEITYEDLKKVNVVNKSFNEPISFYNIPFSTLLKYYKYSDHTKELFYDRLALMLYTLSYVVKGTGELVSDRYETFFCNYYKISSNTFREWTGYTFLTFMKSRYCTPYFHIVFDEARDKFIVRFNESDKNMSKLGNEMVAVRKANMEAMRRKLIGIEKKLDRIEDKEGCIEEKFRWFELLSYAPKEEKEVSVQCFQLNYEYHFKRKLDSNYLSSIFMRSSLSGVIKHSFANELEFIAENGGKIKILCDIPSAILETQKKLDFIRSDEYKRLVNLKRVRLTGEAPLIQPRASKAPVLWDFNKSVLKDILGDEACTPLHEKYSNKSPLSNNVNKKTKPSYISSNVNQSDEDENSENGN
ncbi:Hypothetical protein SRAE_2000080300 [Strongyloides ratti]|uniref:DUF7516 domain-containing protein n=1 Tax=Strongyloides ratti TaxID=34506 RepID=A0A090LDC0_STRRB|nr:Hypothetical protein SRAE_2000080300 [Strongyloides ratti]CEF66133.1 Hypothetical protein SRAE_2000080300 [Strongyloides ratti]